MVDLIRETPVDLKTVANRFNVTMKTVYAWMKGVHGRQLETVKVGGKRVTSLEAIQRFSREDVAPRSVKATRQQDRVAATNRALKEHGL